MHQSIINSSVRLSNHYSLRSRNFCSFTVFCWTAFFQVWFAHRQTFECHCCREQVPVPHSPHCLCVKQRVGTKRKTLTAGKKSGEAPEHSEAKRKKKVLLFSETKLHHYTVLEMFSLCELETEIHVLLFCKYPLEKGTVASTWIYILLHWFSAPNTKTIYFRNFLLCHPSSLSDNSNLQSITSTHFVAVQHCIGTTIHYMENSANFKRCPFWAHDRPYLTPCSHRDDWNSISWCLTILCHCPSTYRN